MTAAAPAPSLNDESSFADVPRNLTGMTAHNFAPKQNGGVHLLTFDTLELLRDCQPCTQLED